MRAGPLFCLKENCFREMQVKQNGSASTGRTVKYTSEICFIRVDVFRTVVFHTVKIFHFI